MDPRYLLPGTLASAVCSGGVFVPRTITSCPPAAYHFSHYHGGLLQPPFISSSHLSPPPPTNTPHLQLSQSSDEPLFLQVRYGDDLCLRFHLLTENFLPRLPFLRQPFPYLLSNLGRRSPHTYYSQPQGPHLAPNHTLRARLTKRLKFTAASPQSYLGPRYTFPRRQAASGASQDG